MGKINSGLEINTDQEKKRIEDFIKEQVKYEKKDGVVIGLSGGIDSALTVSLCIEALGKDRVYGLILPERESNPESATFAKKHADLLGMEYDIRDITDQIETLGAYRKRDDVIKSIYSDYEPENDRIKITLPEDLLSNDSLNIFSLTISRDGKKILKKRLKKWEIKRIIAATDVKQRTRMINLYFEAESRNYLVCGTTNRPETMQGFFVKYGDGGVDIEPISHLYKSQVYSMAREMGVINEILNREPSPDTFNSFVNDQDFFFRMPYSMVDKLLFAWENKLDMDTICYELSLENDQVERAYRDLESKYRATNNLRELPPSLLKRM